MSPGDAREACYRLLVDCAPAYIVVDRALPTGQWYIVRSLESMPWPDEVASDVGA